MKTVKIALLGFGTVGSGTYDILEMNKSQISNSTGCNIEVSKILVRDLNKARASSLPQDLFTNNPADILEDPEIKVVVEVMGGLEPATEYILKALKNHKHVVSANKAAIAHSFEKLHSTALEHRVKFLYEASVCGGIPILTSLKTALQGNRFTKVEGILNGTSNYILSQMTDFKSDYSEVLKKAQELGFAEADPTADVEGIDAANKLSILISIMFGKNIHPDDIPTSGISQISLKDIEDAEAKKCKIKLIGEASVDNLDSDDPVISCSVKPVLIPFDHPLSGVNNEYNGVYVTGNAVGDLMFYGKGAGALPTGSAVVGDIIALLQYI